MTTEEDFQTALDTNPHDWCTRLVFADWLEEHGDERAEGYRMMGLARMVPAGPGSENRRHYEENELNWCWIETITGRSSRCSVKSYWYTHLTKRWVDAPPGLHPSWVGFRVVYPTRRDAEDDAARAWMLVDPQKRSRDLKDAMEK